jgi:glycosyltransferase involved in cell wall biosynthesis
MPLRLKQDKIDNYLSMYPILPLISPCKNTIVIYDLTPILLKETYPATFRIIFHAQLLYAIKMASKVITISQHSRNDIINYLRVPPDKIEIVYPGYDNSLFNANAKTSEISKVKNKYNINGNYILNVGTLEPKKNIVRLIKAFSYLHGKYKVNHSLVIAGKKTWHDNMIFNEAEKSPVSDKIIFTDYVPDKELPALIHGADAFIFPSLHEGFGIPPIEAMACGTPVIASNVTALPEAVGKAGLLIDPYDITDIAEAMYRVITSQSLRKGMILAGLDNCKRFSSNQSALKLFNILK